MNGFNMLKINKIHCGDSKNIIKIIDNESIDLVITSPPYYNAKEYSQYTSVKKYMIIMEEIFIEVERVLKLSRMCIINVSPILIKRINRANQSHRIPIPFYFVPMMEKIGFEFLEDIVWKKSAGSVPNRNGGFYKHRKPMGYKPNIVTEYVLVFKKKADFLIDKILKNDSLVMGNYEKTNVWEFNPETKSDHPAPFPEVLVENCIKYYSYEKDLILDPFIGSGTTAVVAKKLNRNYIGIEKNSEYCEMACERIKKEVKYIENNYF